MDDANKQKFEMITEIVSNTLSSLSTLFTQLGMHGLYAITNPSLVELKTVIKNMHQSAVDVETQISSVGSDLDAVYALIKVQNIKQGLLFAENLLSSIERLDHSECQKAHSDLQNNVINHPVW